MVFTEAFLVRHGQTSRDVIHLAQDFSDTPLNGVGQEQLVCAGSPITLIDGDELVRLIIDFQLYLTPIQTYALDDFYQDN